MATLLAPQAVAITGTTVAFTAADVTGNTFSPNTRGCLHVKNGSGVSITATVVVPGNDSMDYRLVHLPRPLVPGITVGRGDWMCLHFW